MTKFQKYRRHELSDICPEAKTAECSQCGRVSLVMHGHEPDGTQRWKCISAKLQYQAGIRQLRHSLSEINLETSTATCLTCGPTSIGKAGMRNGAQHYRCAVSIAKTAAKRKTDMKPREHFLISQDIESRTGVCKKCGPTKIQSRGCSYKGKASWRCAGYVAPPRKQEARWRDRLKHHYDMTLEDYNQMSEAQGGVCAICKRPDRGRLNVDHDHASPTGAVASPTEAVRKLLCRTCNVGLGCFDDNTSYLSSAIEYLNAHRNQE